MERRRRSLNGPRTTNCPDCGDKLLWGISCTADACFDHASCERCGYIERHRREGSTGVHGDTGVKALIKKHGRALGKG